jgi:hypothetical protein
VGIALETNLFKLRGSPWKSVTAFFLVRRGKALIHSG